jgi:type IV secretion system protein VirB9
MMALAGAGIAVRAGDTRLRSVPYSSDQIYRLRGYAGYQIDLEFERDERFVGLASGDVEGLAFEAQDNHLFIKPKAINVHTNVTVLTSRRSYHFDYDVAPAHTVGDAKDAIYALRFEYPAPPPPTTATPADAPLSLPSKPRNTNYWFCGSATLQPLEAWDDAVHTYLRFDPRGELPAVFVRNDDGTESLLNFSVEHDEVVIHRIAKQLIVRRGALFGCIVNRGFEGGGKALDSGTVSSEVQRATRTSGSL